MIFRNPGSLRVFIRPGRTDMRKAINGLNLIIQQEMKQDPFSHSLFVFCGRSRRLIKLIYWDGNGFCLWQKRLEDGSFPWPGDAMEAMELSREEFLHLLSGIDFRRRHRIVNFQSVG